MFDMADSWDRWRLRFDGYARETLDRVRVSAEEFAVWADWAERAG